jgi:hypothetical protein
MTLKQRCESLSRWENEGGAHAAPISKAKQSEGYWPRLAEGYWPRLAEDEAKRIHTLTTELIASVAE